MEAEKDKLEKYFAKQKIESPSFNFTERVMADVKEVVEKPFVVQPLINKRTWLWIAVVSALVIAFSFILEFIGSVQKMPKIFDWSSIRWADFATSLRIVAGVVSLFVILTLADIIYRKVKNIA